MPYSIEFDGNYEAIESFYDFDFGPGKSVPAQLPSGKISGALVQSYQWLSPDNQQIVNCGYRVWGKSGDKADFVPDTIKIAGKSFKPQVVSRVARSKNLPPPKINEA